MFSFESPHQGDSNEYTQHIIFNMRKKTTLNYPQTAELYDLLDKELKNEFEIAMVNKPSVFEPLKVYCISGLSMQLHNSVILLMFVICSQVGVSGKPLKKSHTIGKSCQSNQKSYCDSWSLPCHFL